VLEAKRPVSKGPAFFMEGLPTSLAAFSTTRPTNFATIGKTWKNFSKSMIYKGIFWKFRTLKIGMAPAYKEYTLAWCGCAG
jgi:hypothetical protein